MCQRRGWNTHSCTLSSALEGLCAQKAEGKAPVSLTGRGSHFTCLLGGRQVKQSTQHLGEEEPQEREEPLGQGCSAGWDRSEKG